MRILLVQPAPFESGRIGLENALWMSEPAALTALAAMVRDEHDVRILDMRLEEPDALPRVLATFRPELVGATVMTTDVYQAHAVACCAHAILGDDVFTIVGGHHPSLAPEDHETPWIDAVCVGEGEETLRELVAHLDGGGDRADLAGIPGLSWRTPSGSYVRNTDRDQSRDLDSFPAPARDLLGDYAPRYFFGPAIGMASIQTSRGCAYDCNFCAIWEFYERKVRFLSPSAIVDRMEQAEERFVMFLDDNFLTHRPRVEELCEEIERRGVRKLWMAQGRSDFVAANPDLMRRLRDAGLMMLLSGYESNDEDALGALRKDNTRANNLEASRILRKLNIWTTGIFMVRPDFEKKDFDGLFATVREMQITAPLVVIHTPLPGTVDYRREVDALLTRDVRLFDLLHAVVPTRLPRERFYEEYARWQDETLPSTWRVVPLFLRRPLMTLRLLPGFRVFLKRKNLLWKTMSDPQSYLRDEKEIIDTRPRQVREEAMA